MTSIATELVCPSSLGLMGWGSSMSEPAGSHNLTPGVTPPAHPVYHAHEIHPHRW